MTFFKFAMLTLLLTVLFTLSIIGYTIATQKQQLTSFTTDGCSMFPDGTFEQSELWLACCTAHDIAYWQGGTKEQKINADSSLKVCVEDVDQEVIAQLMYIGVRMGGSAYLPTSYRWGYGWPYPKHYASLSAEELNAIEKNIADNDLLD